MTHLPTPAAANRGWPFLGAALAAVLAVYVNRHDPSFGFVPFDDDLQVFFNPHLGAPTGPRLAWMFLGTGYNGYYMPLTWLTLSLISSAAGLHPGPYHEALVAFHALNAVLLFVLLRRLLAAVAPARAANAPWAGACALLGSLWWSLNPLRVESTAWISGLCYAQAIAFAFAAVIVHLGPAGSAQGSPSRPRTAAAALLYSCSLLSYPIALGLAPVFFVIDWYRARSAAPGVARVLRGKAGYVIAAVAILAVTLGAARKTEAHFHIAEARLPLSIRAGRAGYALSYYAVKPWLPLHLSRAYPATLARPGAEPGSLSRPFWTAQIELGVAATLALFAFTLAVPRLRRLLGPFLLCHVLLLAPMLGLTMGGDYITFDRYCTLSCAAWAAAIALLLLGSGAAIRTLVVPAFCCYLAFLAVLSERQALTWRSPQSLWGSFSDHLGPGEFTDLQYESPAYVYRMSAEYDKADAVIARGLAAAPGDPGLLAARADTADLRKSNPGTAAFAEIHVIQARAFLRQDDARMADEHLRLALELSPRYVEAAYDRALTRISLGDFRGALHDLLWAEACGPRSIPDAQRKVVLGLVRDEAAAAGNLALADAAGRRL